MLGLNEEGLCYELLRKNKLLGENSDFKDVNFYNM